MTDRIPDYFDSFACLAGACPDTCCGQWEIIIDDDAKARYLTLEGTLGQRIRASLLQQDGETCLALDGDRCPLLTEDGLCAVILEQGKEFLSTTCSAHPRFTEEYGSLRETMLSISCPAAARLLLEQETPLTFLTHSDNVPPDGPNDLDPDLMHALLTSRETAYGLVQNRSRSMSDRLALLLDFACRLDGVLQRERWQLAQRLSDLYRNPHYADDRLIRLRRLRRHGTMTRVRQLLQAMEHLSADYPAILAELEAVSPDCHPIPMEQLAMYFLFRWWLKAACSGQLWQQAAACVVSCLTVAGLSKTMHDFTEAARLFSKEVEHSDDNLALLRRAMDLNLFCRDELLKLLEVSHAV